MIWYVAYHSAAKYKLLILSTIQYDRQMRYLAILETETETESWLP